jgi:DMSO reductase anchor subunit
MMAMKNWRTSWLSREAIALGTFTGMMSINVAFYIFNISTPLRLIFELLTLAIGLYGIHAQAMIYRIPARPAWDRVSTNRKFFGTAYVGFLMVATFLVLSGHYQSAIPLVSLAMIAAVVHGFFTIESYKELKNSAVPELQKSSQLYRKYFSQKYKIRTRLFIIGALLLPLLSTLFITTNSTVLGWALLVLAFSFAFLSELIDRFLFYTTVVPLSMAGGFFVGTQRH